MIINLPKEIDITAFWEEKKLLQLQDEHILKASLG
jgi:hypothetical protein